jgi:hypothetical protein
MHALLALCVIPAKRAKLARAGIHNPGLHDADRQGVWIPALASLGRHDAEFFLYRLAML